MKNKILFTLSEITINDKVLPLHKYLLIIKENILIIDNNVWNKKPIFTMNFLDVIEKKDSLLFLSKKNKALISIKKIFWNMPYELWNEVENFTILEKDRKKELLSFIKKENPNLNIISELEVDSGFIDLVIQKEKTFFIIELKNRKLQKKDVSQLLRYNSSIPFQNKQLILIGTSFSKELKLYWINKGVTILTYNNYKKWIKEKL